MHRLNQDYQHSQIILIIDLIMNWSAKTNAGQSGYPHLDQLNAFKKHFQSNVLLQMILNFDMTSTISVWKLALNHPMMPSKEDNLQFCDLTM